MDTRKKEKIKEDSMVPVNCMGASSSAQGTGGIDTFDPLLRKKKTPRKLRDVLRVHR